MKTPCYRFSVDKRGFHLDLDVLATSPLYVGIVRFRLSVAAMIVALRA